MSPLHGATEPLFWTSGDVCSGFQSQGGSLFAYFLASVILRFTSGVSPTDFLMANMTVKPFRSMYLQMSLQALLEVRTVVRAHDCRKVSGHW